MFILIIVDLNDLLKAIYAFYQLFPLLTSLFKFIFYLNSVMIMLSVKRDAVHAEKFLGMVLTSDLIAIEHLDPSPVALTWYVVSRCPITNH